MILELSAERKNTFYLQFFLVKIFFASGYQTQLSVITLIVRHIKRPLTGENINIELAQHLGILLKIIPAVYQILCNHGVKH